MTTTFDPVAGVAQAMLKHYRPKPKPPRKWATPGELAKVLDPTTVQTPALELIDRELVALANGDVDRLMIFMPPQEGKALALDTPIATPSGWTTMGALRVGDQVFDRQGNPCSVTWTSPTWTDRPCYTVRTGDGEAIVADAEHEWFARLDRRNHEQLHTTKVLAHSRAKNAQITGPAPLNLPDADLPLDPYVLGAWLGDGSTAAAAITSADQEIVDRIRATGTPCRKMASKYGWSLAPQGSSNPSPVRQALISVGVWDNKHVPDRYHRASAPQRLALLQGLIDTDGYLHPKGQVEFTSTCKQLALDVQRLVYSLGAKATIAEGRATLNGKDCGPKFRVKFYLAHAAHLPRKATRCKDSSVAQIRYTWAEPAVSVPTRCIEVDSPDHSFLAGWSLLPTHNSVRTSHRFVEWLLSHNHDLRVAVVSYADEMARRWGGDIKLDAQTFIGEDGDVDLGLKLRADSRAAGRWQIDGCKGGVYCVGIGGPLTGRAVDVLIIDDPIKNLEEAQSGRYRKRTHRFWQGVCVPRLGPGSKCVVIQTRWHADDLSGWLLKQEPGRWRVVSIPAIAESPDDPLGRRVGEPMVSARGQRDWAAIRASVGEYVWAALYQQRPAPAAGGLFKRAALRYWRPLPADPTRHGLAGGRQLDLGGRRVQLEDCWRFLTVDLAASEKTSADYTAVGVWALGLDGDLILLEAARERIEETDHWGLVRPLREKWAADTVFVESRMFGTTLVYEAGQAGVPIAELKADTDKITRALPATARADSGRLWLPSADSAEWVSDFVDELLAFPNGAHDDLVDITSYAARVAAAHWLPGESEVVVAARRASVDQGVIGEAFEAATGGRGGGMDFFNVPY